MAEGWRETSKAVAAELRKHPEWLLSVQVQVRQPKPPTPARDEEPRTEAVD